MSYILAIPALVWIILSAAVYAFGEFYSKKFALVPSWKIALVVVACYAFDALLWLPAIYQRKIILTTTLLWTVMSMVSIVIIGYFVFGERLNMAGSIGVVFAIISIILLSI